MESTDKEVEVKKNIINKIKVPKEQKEKIYVKIFKEFGIAILIFIYFLFLDLGYIRVEESAFKNDLHTFAGILVISAVLLFESAYRKDSNEVAIHGVEVLVLAILTLFMPYIYFYRGISFKFLYSISPIYIAAYFSVKSFVIYNMEVKKYRDSLSDVKEILNDDEKSYLDEENKKKFDEIKLENEEPTRKSNTKKKMAKIINENKKTTPGKRGRKKKAEVENIQNEDNDDKTQEDTEKTVSSKITRKRGPRKKATVEDDLSLNDESKIVQKESVAKKTSVRKVTKSEVVSDVGVIEDVPAKKTTRKRTTTKNVANVSDETEETKTVKKASTRAKKVNKTEEVTSTTTVPKKRGRPRKKTKIDVKPLATAGRSKKKDGDNKND